MGKYDEFSGKNKSPDYYIIDNFFSDKETIA